MPSLLGLFAEHVARAPDHPAIASGLTYEGLDRASSAMARAMVASGVQPGDVVSLRMGRSEQLVVAILAVLKAGAVFFPLGTSQPEVEPRSANEIERPRVSSGNLVTGRSGRAMMMAW